MSKSSEAGLNLCVGVTAHRDLVPGEIPALEARLRDFFQDLAQDFPGLPLQLLTPLAEGGDQLAARVALSLDIPIVAVLPMDQRHYEEDFVSDETRSDFRELLQRASRVIKLPSQADSETQETSPEGRARKNQYARLGVFISNHCHVLLALWDGKPGTELGGTGQVVRYHLTAVMPGIEAEPSAASLLADNENDLVHHIVCSRDRPAGEPAEGLEPLQARWFSSREESRPQPRLPDDYRVLLQRMQQFDNDWRDKRSGIAARSSSLLEDAEAGELPAGARLTDQFFRVADGLAMHYQRRVNRSLAAIHALAVLMGLVFLLYSEYEGSRYLVLGFLGLFFVGVALQLIGERREWHRKYLDYRTLAEGLRVQLYWNLSGVVDEASADFAYDNFLQKQDVDLGWIRHVMRLASLHRDRCRQPDDAWVPWVTDQWVGNPGRGQGQLAYYARKEMMNTSRFRRTQRLGSLCLWAGILFAFMLFYQRGGEDSLQRQVLLVLMGALPLIAGVWDAYSYKKAERELIKQYGFMRRVYARARKLLDQSPDVAFQRRILQALGEAALDEGAEWLLMHRQRPLEHGRL